MPNGTVALAGGDGGGVVPSKMTRPEAVAPAPMTTETSVVSPATVTFVTPYCSLGRPAPFVPAAWGNIRRTSTM